jgi:hypothetical protein
MARKYSRHAEPHSFCFLSRLRFYLDSIDSISTHEYMEDASTWMELALWKFKITEQFGQNNACLPLEMKMQCRADSI